MQSYPFTSQVTFDEQGLPLYDRAVDSGFLRKVFAQYFSNGLFYKPTNAMQVVADAGMQVKVNPGVCHIQGAIGIEDAQRTLAVQASEAMDRIDTVVARLDLSIDARCIDLYVLKGTAADSPQAPALTRNSAVWELGLANIFVAKNTAMITQQRITDTRLDNSRCGVVAQTIGELDTAPYYTQLQAMVDDLQEVIDGIEQGSEVMLRAVYDPAGKAQDIFSYGYSKAESDARYATAAQGAAADAAMPKSGGTFTGNIVAITTNREGSSLRNSTVMNSNWTVTPLTNMIVFTRK